MTNMGVKKVPINKERVMTSLYNKNLSLRGLDRDPNFKHSTKTIGLAINSGLVSPSIMDELARYLSVSSDYLSGIESSSLSVYKFLISTNNKPIIKSVICTNEPEATEIIYMELVKLFKADCFWVKLVDILPIVSGTII